MGSALRTRPVGIVGNDEFGPVIAERIAASNVPALYAALPGSPPAHYGPHLEPMPPALSETLGCPVLLMAVEDTQMVRALLTGGASGFDLSLQAGTVLVDLGARTPRELDALLELLAPRGSVLTDAAIIGGPEAAAEGRARILLGGDDAAVEMAKAVVGLLGHVECTGPLGSAHAAAALMGYVEAAHAVAREEAIALGAACGLTPEMITRVLTERSGAGGMNVVQLARRADLARRIARDKHGAAEIIDLAAAKLARAHRENR
jgi:3-hydroxyisobutyrate dehydrogenase